MLILVGTIRWRSRNRVLVGSFLLMIGLAVWLGAIKQFSYGLYKVLTIGSVLLFPAIFLGLDTLTIGSTGQFVVRCLVSWVAF